MALKRPSQPVKEEPDELQRVRMMAAAKALATGKVHIPLRCGFCRGASLYQDANRDIPHAMRGEDAIPRPRRREEPILTCVSCGRRTRLETAKKLRQVEIKAFIERGIDVELKGKKQ